MTAERPVIPEILVRVRCKACRNGRLLDKIVGAPAELGAVENAARLERQQDQADEREAERQRAERAELQRAVEGREERRRAVDGYRDRLIARRAGLL